jgi:hypothetical protein
MGLDLLIIFIALVLVVLLIAIYTRSVADAALTDPFRAAESIANGKFPQKWSAQIERRLALKRQMPGLFPEVSGTSQALQKIDRLIRYFDKSPFFDTAEARELLLSMLKETRQRWSTMTWEDIKRE